MASKSQQPPNEWGIARLGICLFLNNKVEEAEELFSKHPDSFHVKAGRCFVMFMNSLMTFESDKLQQTIVLLKDMERECASDIGWLKSMKSKVFGTEETGKEYVNRLERQIILADSQVCSAILTLLQQELAGYVRSGWMLRKAWRVYQHAYTQVSQLYRRTFGTSPIGIWEYDRFRSRIRELRHTNVQRLVVFAKKSAKSRILGMVNTLLQRFSKQLDTGLVALRFVEPSEVTRLMSAVSFGYGVYQLCVSLLPSSLSKVVHFLGFEGDRQVGLSALMYARLSEDMHAPLATLSLLWYHTVVRPFFVLDGSNVNAGVTAAKQLISESQEEFHESALFLFFSGRVERLESNIDSALEAYEKAIDISTQREVKLFCLHEIVWCHLIRLNYKEAYRSLLQLYKKSRWSKCFYGYLATVCCGANDRFDVFMVAYRKVSNLISTTRDKESQIGIFILRRASKLVDQETGRPYTALYYKLLMYELLYLWNAMPSCSTESLQTIVSDCKNNRSEEPMVGLTDLVKGAAYSYLGDIESSIKSYQNCLKRRSPSKDLQDQHVSAFALYELGRALCNNNNTEEGKNALLKIETRYKDYDFEGRLLVRIHSALNDLP